MLQLKNIVKVYKTADSSLKALKGIDVEFRESEFVSILGPSGCGKTTLLNIIGGLDDYTSGNLIINGKSTKEYKDKDWDNYRNHRVGFVFQSYNLIPHQTILSNVELALTISGVSKSERRKKAISALKKVGLGDQIKKKPNQMSGGQMQRVAIARALVNDPDILLADEPTGALDSSTSVQIMNILKEISKDKLIIMVTHNNEIADQYSSRIIKLLDGKIIDDSNPYKASKDEIEEAKVRKEKAGKASMSFLTAIQLSLNNLMTKKGRTLLTSFAGSIGIIGIALIMSLSHGMQSYIDKVEEDTLTSYPIVIQDDSIDMTSVMESLMNDDVDEDYDQNKVYSDNIMSGMLETLSTKITSNNLVDFKKYMDDNESSIKDYTNAIQYNYDINMNIFKQDKDGYQQVNPNIVFDKMGFANNQNQSGNNFSNSFMVMKTDVFTEMLDNQKLMESQYEVLTGKFPQKYNEMVLIVDKYNRVSDYVLYSLGLKDINDVEKYIKSLENGEEIVLDNDKDTYSFDDILNVTYKLVLNTDYYEKSNGVWLDKSNDEKYMKDLINSAEEVKIVGIIKPKEETVIGNVTGMVGYTKELEEYVIDKINNQDIVKEQQKNSKINVFTGMPFMNEEFDYSKLTSEQKAYMSKLSETALAELMQAYTTNSNATYEGNLAKLGVVDINKPSSINIYPKDFESKDILTDKIAEYNKIQEDNGKDENVINYTDFVGIMMSSVSTVINVISYVLMAFVSISLVVSSIMIGIITYISVLERTKEIGILRSIGASKKDVSRVFNAETLIIGLVAGLLGIGVTLLLNIPINLIIKALVKINRISRLPFVGATFLVIISVLLTVIAGFIPAKLASKKDPAEVLRVE